VDDQRRNVTEETGRIPVSVIGLGRLGAPLAAVLASRGHRVFGMDVSAHAVERVNAGDAPVAEPGLQELMTANPGRFTATTDIAEAVNQSAASFIVVPTPSGPDGGFSLKYVLEATNAIGRALAASQRRGHLVVITSTVMPGSTNGPIRDNLERASGMSVGTDIGLCYSPEFIALGTVVRDILNPDLIMIGESDPAAGAVLEGILVEVPHSSPPVRRMSPVDAEIAKLAVNTFVTTKISYANMLAELCERLPGADVEMVTGAVGLDTRIGSKYLTAGTPYGGPCFPRDNVALAAAGRAVGVSMDVALATDSVNRRQVDRIVGMVTNGIPPGSIIAVLGLSYKPGTPVIDESTGVHICSELRRAGYRVVAYDPAAGENARRFLGDTTTVASTAQQCLAGADAAVIATPWPQFGTLAAAGLGGSRVRRIVDCWRMLEGDPVPGIEIVHLGVATKAVSNAGDMQFGV
jgi:UDPglucose 6-dehydrogenase